MKKYFKEFKNPLSLFLFEKGIKKEVIVKHKDERIKNFKLNQDTKGFLKMFIELKPRLDYSKIEEFSEFFYQMVEPKEIIEYSGLKMYNNRFVAINIEYFLKEYCYDIISYNNRSVIDIGANAGESCLFFAKEGATVYGFEPVPPIYEAALKNININEKLKNKIQIYCEAISCKKGQMEIAYNSDRPAASSSYHKTNEMFTVETNTLENIIEKYNIKPDVLKIDCEGCEIEIMNNSDLHMFNDILLEHHAKFTNTPADELIKILEEQGFKVDKLDENKVEFEKQGIIHAYK